MNVVKIWCEWDINQEGVLFSSEAVAREWVLGNESLEECFEPGLSGMEAIDDLVSGGLLGFKSCPVLEMEDLLDDE